MRRPEWTYGTDGGVLNGIRGRANNVSDLAQGAIEAAGVDQTTLPPMTILLMGVDARPGEAIDIGVRPDALAVLRLDPATGSCRMLAIPRDSRVDLPGYGLTKINHALAVGGIPYQELVVQNFLGITIDKYALIDFGGITELVECGRRGADSYHRIIQSIGHSVRSWRPHAERRRSAGLLPLPERPGR